LPPIGAFLQYFQFASVLAFVILGVALVALMTGLSWLLPSKSSPGCDHSARAADGQRLDQLQHRFYLVALIFVIFDVGRLCIRSPSSSATGC
jgi:NADH:ubiquinone oxidoreductase subunit 3 (subunit A)